MTNKRGYPGEYGATAPAPAEPADTEVRTFADIENGDPDTILDELVMLDAAIL